MNKLALLLFLLSPVPAWAQPPTVPFVVVDHAKQIENFWTPTIRQAAIDAINEAEPQFAAYWNIQAHIYLKPEAIPANAIRIILDDRRDGVLDGAHYSGGFIRVHVGRCFFDQVPVSVAIAHEVNEFLVDPFVVASIDSPYGPIETEVGDPVWGWTYTAPNGQLLADFVTPSWFGMTTTAPYDAINKLTEPFELSPNGYVTPTK